MKNEARVLGLRFNNEVSLGQLVQLVGFIVSIFAALWLFDRSVSDNFNTLSGRIKDVQAELSLTNQRIDLLVKGEVMRQRVELDRLQHRVLELEKAN